MYRIPGLIPSALTTTETDLQYFSRRAAEEIEAAGKAETDAARDHHLELARLYGQVADIYRDDAGQG
jgi:hypothetical protein